MLQTVKNYVQTRTEKSLLNEALKAHKLIQESEDCSHPEDCAHYLKLYQGLVRNSKQKEIYAPEDAQAILMGKLYQQAGSNCVAFKQGLETLLDEHQGALTDLKISKEEGYELLMNAKREEYNTQLHEVVSQLEETLENNENNIVLTQKYDLLKTQISYHLKDGAEIHPSVTQIMPDGTEHELDLDAHVYSLAVQIGINNLANHIEKLPAEEVATDNFQEHYEKVLGQIVGYAGKVDLDQEKAGRLQEVLGTLDQEMSTRVESVKEGIGKKQDRLYKKAEFSSQTVEKLFEEAFEEFARHSFSYQRILEDSPEDISDLYQQLKP
ncbi:MAG: hypothetical protein ABIA37_00910 [Candidatus Woesearchaeota archaeon]